MKLVKTFISRNFKEIELTIQDFLNTIGKINMISIAQSPCNNCILTTIVVSDAT